MGASDKFGGAKLGRALKATIATVAALSLGGAVAVAASSTASNGGVAGVPRNAANGTPTLPTTTGGGTTTTGTIPSVPPKHVTARTVIHIHVSKHHSGCVDSVTITLTPPMGLSTGPTTITVRHHGHVRNVDVDGSSVTITMLPNGTFDVQVTTTVTGTPGGLTKTRQFTSCAS